MRFSVRSLFFVMTIVAMIGGVIVWVRNLHYVQLRRVNSVLTDYPEIEKVWLGTNEDVELEVEQLYFSIVGQPELTYRIDGIDGASKLEIRRRLEHALREKRPVQRPDYVTRHWR